MNEQAKDKQDGCLPVELDLDIKARYIDADTVVSKSPCWMYSIVLTGTASGENSFTLRDGFDEYGKEKMRVSAIQHDSVPVILRYPIRFSKGLFAEKSAGTCYATIQYKSDY